MKVAWAFTGGASKKYMPAFLERLRGRMAGQGYLRPALHECSEYESETVPGPLPSTEQQVDTDPIGWAYRTIALYAAEPLASDAANVSQSDLTHERLAAAIQRLLPDQLRIVKAWIRQGLTSAQVAAVEGISKKEATARIKRVLCTLMDELDSSPDRDNQR